jgi:diguanylate cyclase (GGDEF)-like protein
VAVTIPGTAPAHWLVFEHAGRGTRLERRVLTTATQACAAVSLAKSRTEMISELQSAASSDGLTGVANRRTFDQAIADLAGRSEVLPLSVLLTDIDHFKLVNDTHGHQMGDDVLRGVAGVLAATARGTDLVARYGGEEFVVLLARTTEADACEVAERMRSRIADYDGAVPVTASIGVASTRDEPIDLTTLVAQADQALYRAKDTGRNRVVAYDPAEDRPAA